MNGAKLQAVVTLAMATAACSAATPTAETPQPRSAPAHCPRTDTSWVDAAVIGVSAADLTTQLGQPRTLAVSQGDAARLFPAVTPPPKALVVSLAAGAGAVTVSRCPHVPVRLSWPVRVSLAAPGASVIQFEAQMGASAADSASVTGLASFPVGATSVGLWLNKSDADLLAGSPPVRWSTLCQEDPETVATRVLGKPLAQVLSDVSREPLVCRKEGGVAANSIVLATPLLSLAARTGAACREQTNLGAYVVPAQIVAQASDGWIMQTVNGTVTLDESRRTALIGATGRAAVNDKTKAWLGCASAAGTFSVSFRAVVPASASTLELVLVSECEDSTIRCTSAAP